MIKQIKSLLVLMFFSVFVAQAIGAERELTYSGIPCNASSIENGSLACSYAFDRNTGTRWSSAHTDNEWIYVDLGSEYEINRIEIDWETAYGLAFTIEVSNDASNWTLAANQTYSYGGNELIGLAPGYIGRYVRMNGQTRATPWGYSMFEMRVYGDDAAVATHMVYVSDDHGGGPTSPQGGVEVVEGGSLEITVPVQEGWTFDYWVFYSEGASTTIDDIYSRTTTVRNINGATGVTAFLTYTPPTYYDVYVGDYRGGGQTTPNGITQIVAGGQLAVAAIPDQDYEFLGWTVQGAGTATIADPSALNTLVYNIQGNISVLAGFNYNPNPEQKLTYSGMPVVTSSNENSGTIGAYAVDANSGTRWSSTWNDAEWIYLDLGESYEITRVILDWEAAYGAEYKIYTSNNLSTWNLIHHETSGNGGIDELDITDPDRFARYIRMQGVSRSTIWGYSLYEFEVYGNSYEEPPCSFTDSRDGQTYDCVEIGTQTWMAENLNYNASESYCHGDDEFWCDIFGRLYTWNSAMDGSSTSNLNPSGVKGMCPTGWHLPSNEEWIMLENYLADNGYNYDGTTGGGSLKIAKAMAATTSWNTSDSVGAIGNDLSLNNASGFSGLAGGLRDYTNGSFVYNKTYAIFWTSTEFNGAQVYFKNLACHYPDLFSNYFYKSSGFYVRCVKD